jgi:hypothetical protein
MKADKNRNNLLVEEIDWIINLEENPVLRNLLITQSYHDLSIGLSWLLGRENANWCNFATWASRTAGGFIRDEEVPSILREKLETSSGYTEAKQRIKNSLQNTDPAEGHHSGIFQLPGAIVGDVSEQITAGNLKVYAELAPIFSQFIKAFREESNSAHHQLAEIIDTLSEGHTEEGGQSLLKAALTNYFNAMRDLNPKSKAESILLANGQIGLHEQSRLQPFIQGSLDAPIEEMVDSVFSSFSRALPFRLGEKMSSWLKHVMHPLTRELEKTWEIAATRELMTLKISGETLHLGKSLHAGSGKSLYPDTLETIANQELQDTLERFNALHIDHTRRTAKDWAILEQRMRYIFDLFRSRQQDPKLFDPPFSQSQRDSMLNMVIPGGKLG